MSSTYLPADVRTRIIDLMKEHNFHKRNWPCLSVYMKAPSDAFLMEQPKN